MWTVAGCAVERFTAVEAIDGELHEGGATGGEAPFEGVTDAEDVSEAGTVLSDCRIPAFTTSSPRGIWDSGGYFVFNNVWNTDAGPGPQTLYACSYNSWYVVSDQPQSAGAVKSYPNVQMNFNEVPISSFHSITSTFAEKSPGVGIYEDAYDIWLNGVATPGSRQIMIWVDNYNRVPTGSRVTTTNLGGRTYDVWRTTDSAYIALVSAVPFTSGAVNLLEIFNWTIAQGYIPPSATLGQIDFGVEIVSTGGASGTYLFNDFSITTN